MPLRRRTSALAALVLALPCSLAIPRPARGDDPARRGFDVDPGRPALSAEGGFFVESADRPAQDGHYLGLRLDYAEGLLALKLAGDREQLLRSRLSGHLMGGLSHGPWELGIHLPVVLAQRDDLGLLRRQGVTGPMVDPVASSALGDLRLLAKRALLVGGEGGAPLGLAALLDLRLPTGDRKAFAGDGLSVQPGLVATRALGRVRLDVQLGYLFRSAGQYAQLVVHDGVVYGAGASTALGSAPTTLAGRTRAFAELVGGWPRGDRASTERYRAPLAVRSGLRATLRPGLALEAGAGTGLGAAGYGRESWRVFAGIRLSPRASEQRAPEPVPGQTDRGLPGDRDGDGVADAKDLCPDVPGAADMDGCPDRDGDFIPDPQDKCPDEPGPAANDGCPVGDGPLVEIETTRLSLKDAIHFDTAQATIKHDSDRVLDAIATLLKDHRELRRIRVEGHTDNVGSSAYNHDLSQRRAAAVVKALMQRGIAAGRLIPKGYGFDKPIADNRTALGRAKNRRVEFTILDESP